jgi:ABC-2 type transport system permease protein
MNRISEMRNSLSDSIVMSGRVLRHMTRSIDTIITVVAMPSMMMLMFVYVFGGAIDTGAVQYIDFIVPGIILMCIASAVAYTAFRVNNDVTKGIFERFHSMPIARSSVLAGHVLSSLVFNTVSVLIILLLAFVLGFRTDAGIVGWLSISGVLLLFTLALTWIAVMFGLLARSSEGASVFSYLVLILLFISSSFVPTDTMPRALRIFAENQPMTPVIETLRSLMLHRPPGRDALVAVLWFVAILAVSYVAATRIYRLRRV